MKNNSYLNNKLLNDNTLDYINSFFLLLIIFKIKSLTPIEIPFPPGKKQDGHGQKKAN